MLITREERADVGSDERAWKWRPLRCWSREDGSGDEDDYEAMLKRSWSFSDAGRGDPLLLVRPLRADAGPLGDGWWMRSGTVWEHSEAQHGGDGDDKKDAGGGSIAGRVKSGGRRRGKVTQRWGGGAKLVLLLDARRPGKKLELEVHCMRAGDCWEVVKNPRGVVRGNRGKQFKTEKYIKDSTNSASTLHQFVVVVPVKHLELRAAKYDVSLREAPLWATLAMHTILSRMVMFHCTTCNERFPTFHPAYRPPDELDLELLGRPRTNKRHLRLPPCCVDVATWDEVPSLKESEEELLVAREYTGRCLNCHRDIHQELERLQKKDSAAQEGDVVPLRGWQNRMDPCYRFPYHDLGDLFASATVTEARFVALEHMQIDFVTVRKSRLDKFRKNIISFPQSLERFGRRMLQHFRVGDRVNSVRGPGADLERPPVLARDAPEPDRKQFATDKEGHLVFPGTVTRVEGVERVYVKYDHVGDEDFAERVECLQPRIQMPWHPQWLQGQLVIMLTQNVRYGDAIEGLEVRWELVCKILKALTAMPGLFPHVTCGLPWRFGGSMDEPMHRWYDPKHGMFDVLSEADVRRLYAPKLWEGEVLSPEEAQEFGGGVAATLAGCDLRTPKEMIAAGLDVRVDVDAADPTGAGRSVVEVEDFAAWLQLRDLDLASHLLAWWRELDIGPLGETMTSLKENDTETPVDFYRKLKDELKRRDWLDEGEVTIHALARWCQEVVRGRFADAQDFSELDSLSEYMRLEFRIVQEQSANLRGSCSLEGDAAGADLDDATREVAEYLADTAPHAAKAVYSWHKVDQEPSGYRDPGRLERAHPLEFPLGIGGLYDDVRDDAGTQLRSVGARVWAQHLFRLWGGPCVHGLRGHRLVWAITNMLLLQETRGKGYVVQKNALGRMGARMDPNVHMTRDALRAALKDEELARSLVNSLMKVGQNVRSTPMQWAAEGKKLDCAIKHVSWAPPWVQPCGDEHSDLDARMASLPFCYMGENEMVEDQVGYGRIPATWWTLNHRYNYDYEVHRLNVSDRAATRHAVTSNDAEAKRHRFNFVRDAPDVVVKLHALRAELHMKMVMPAVLGSSDAQPPLSMCRFETGPNGNPHFHGISYGHGNPRLDGLKEMLAEGAGVSGSAAEGDGAAARVRVIGEGEDASAVEGVDDALVSSGDESGGDVVVEEVADGSSKERARRRQRNSSVLADATDPEDKDETAEMDLLEKKTDEFWKFFRHKVSEWNPCQIDDDGRLHYRWDEEIGAHDVEVAVDTEAVDDAVCGVCLEDYCPDVAATPHTVRLRSVLERCLFDTETGQPLEEVDLQPLRQLLAALVNCGNRHDRHGVGPPTMKDACARGKPECPYCRYGFPHRRRPRSDELLLEQGEREGQWDARFPRNDELVGSFEAHVLLANLGNVDWRPMLNLWAVVEYVSKYAMKAPGKTKAMRDVLRDCVDEVCKYTKDGEGVDLFRKSLQKFYSKSIGGRDYGVFEAVHVGLGLPLVFSLLPVEGLNITGARAYKSGKALETAQEQGLALTWDSKVDKFDKRLGLVRQSWRGQYRREERYAGGAAREALAARERPIRCVSAFEFYSKYFWKRNQVVKRARPVALQVTPGFSADCAAIDHDMHQAYARTNVLAYWRLMPTLERNRMAWNQGCAVDGRKYGSTLLEEPFVHAGGEPSDLDRFLGFGDLYEAFETGVKRRELQWAGQRGENCWRRHETAKRIRNCDWSFAMMEMLVDPVLRAWVPKWVVEQYERRNPDFRTCVADTLKADKEKRLTNRRLLLDVRRELLRRAKQKKAAAAAQAAARAEGDEGDGQAESSSGDSSGGEDKKQERLEDEEEELRRRMVQEPLPGDASDADDGGDLGEPDDGTWGERTAEERASAAAPAPALPDVIVPPRLRCFMQGVSVNPKDHDWAADNVVSLAVAMSMKQRSDAWCGEAAGGDGARVSPEEMDPEQRFAYRIHERKMDEREGLEQQGLLKNYRALRMILTGPPGAGKSRTVRAIAAMRGRRARRAAERLARSQGGNERDVEKAGEEAARLACLLAAPTGTASFQMKARATTLHRLFGIPIHAFGPTRNPEQLSKRARLLKLASLIGLDEFSMIGRQMLGKVVYKVDEALGSERPDAGLLKSMGGKDVMFSGDPDQAAPIGDESFHKEGASRKEGVRGTRDAQGRVRRADPDAKEAWELSDSGLAFRNEFDDVVLLEERHRLVDPSKEDVASDEADVFVEDLARFRDVMERLANLTITREDHDWLSKRNRSRLSADERKLFEKAVLLMDTKKQRVERGSETTQLDGADYKNLEELYKLAARSGVPVVRFGSYHKKREGEEGLRAELIADDDFGLASELQLCEGARVLLSRNLWVEAGLVNGSMGTVKGFVWPQGGDPTSSDSRKRAPYCVIVEFDDVRLDELAEGSDGSSRVVERRRFFEDVVEVLPDGSRRVTDRSRWVPIFRVEAESKTEKDVRRQQFPLTLAWALTHWKAQGMTLRRCRVSVGEKVAGTVGVGLVAMTRVGHPWHLMLETDLPPYEAFVAARVKPEFRSRQRYKLRLQAKASRTIRKYGFYERDLWKKEEATLADRLLGNVARETERERRATGTMRDPDAWVWRDHTDAPVEDLLGRAVAQAVHDGMDENEALRIAERLCTRWHEPALLEAAGCLIPRELHPSMDGVKPKGGATPGGTAGGVSVEAGGWSVNVGDERSIMLEGQPLSKGVLELGLILLRHACAVLRLKVAVGSVGLGALIGHSECDASVVARAARFKTWADPEGLREKFLAAEEIWVPITMSTGKQVRECVVVTVRSGTPGGLLREADALVCEFYDRLRRVGFAKGIAAKLEMLLPRPSSVRGGRDVEVSMRSAVPDGENLGDVACVALGLAVKCVADAAGLSCANPEEIGFVHGLRHRLAACLQYLRDEAYRRGVRDAVRAAVRDHDEGRRRRAVDFFRGVLERLAAPSTAATPPRTEADLSVRALREVTLKLVGMQATHFATWNVAGDDIAECAPATFKKEEKALWLRSTLERWSDVDILAVQESPSAAALSALSGVYRLVGGSRKSHAERYVQLYVRSRVEAQAARPAITNVPAVAAWVTLDAARVLVVSVHLAAGREKSKARARQMQAVTKYVDEQIAKVDSGKLGAVGAIVLGDFNVRADEVPILLELGDWREAVYHGKSWNPVVNRFYPREPDARVEPLSFDRVLFKGHVNVASFLAGTERRWTNGRAYALSDHFAVYGLLDAHVCHGLSGSRAVRDQRRVDLGKQRDARAAAEKDFVTLRERSARDQDWDEQQRVSLEERQAHLEAYRKSVKERRERKLELRAAAHGEGTLFSPLLSDDFARLGVVQPKDHAEFVLPSYAEMLGRDSDWSAVEGGRPAPALHHSGSAAIDFAVQTLLRLLPVALWFESHVKLCADVGQSESCVVCALRSCRKDLGKRLGQTLLRGRFSLGYSAVSGQGVGCEERNCAQYLCRLLDAMRSREATLGHSVADVDGTAVSHVDRLFRFWTERRRECLTCKSKSVVFDASWMWSVGVSDFPRGVDVTVQELYLGSCAERNVELSCVCCKRVCAHREQQRMASLPNVLVVCVERDTGSEGFAVLAEDQLSFPALGPNLELASVCYTASRSMCAVRCGDGDFWWFDAGRAFHCLGPSVCGVMKSRVSLLVYQRQKGEVDFGRPVHGTEEMVSQERGVGGSADDNAFARAASTLMPAKRNNSVDGAETVPFKSIAEQKQILEAKRQEKRLATVAALAERRKRLKLVGAEEMSRWLRAGAQGTAAFRDTRGAPTREKQHGAVASIGAVGQGAAAAELRGRSSREASAAVGSSSDASMGAWRSVAVPAPAGPLLRRYKGKPSAASGSVGVGPCATAASVPGDVGAGAATSSAEASSHDVGRVSADSVVQAQSAGVAVGVANDGDAGRMLAWAALDFEGGRQVGAHVGIDPLRLAQLGTFPDWRGLDELGWTASEVGFFNGGNECYMISLIQMLGTACRVRQAIGELPVSGQPALTDQITRVLHQDFVSPNPRDCASGRFCHLFTDGRRGSDFKHGLQHDAEEALRYVLDAWARAEGGAVARGRPGFVPMGVSGVHHLFSVVVEWRRGCFAETTAGARCKSVFSKLEEFLVLPVLPPPGGRNRKTHVKWQLENFGAPELAATLRCDDCRSVGSCIRRQYLARVGPLLLVQLAVYDEGTRRKLVGVRIHADERVTLRVGSAEREYQLVAAVEHVGESLNSGHYVCYRRDGADGSWIVLNDDGGTPLGVRHRSRFSAAEFCAHQDGHQMYLCMYALSTSGVGMSPVAPRDGDGHVGDASSSADPVIIDLDPDVAESDRALVAAAERWSLEGEEGYEATSVSGTGVEGRRSVRVRSPPRRPLRRHQHPPDRLLRRSGAMMGDDEVHLSATFSRLGIAGGGGEIELPIGSAGTPAAQPSAVADPVASPPSQRDDVAPVRGPRVAVPRRTDIAGMGEILAENQFVEREMERRDFQRRDGQWVDGVLLHGDPTDDADLEPFLRRQFQAQQGDARVAFWGPGRTLGRR